MNSFAYTICYVTDVEKTISFYEDAFGFKRKFIAPGNSYGELNTGATTLSFATVAMAESNLSKGFLQSDPSQKAFGIEIGIVTDDVATTVDTAIKAGATLEEAAKTKPWGQTVAYLRDPNGFLLEICTAMS